MSLLLTQGWDVLRGREDDYAAFVTEEFIPRSNRLGLLSVGGFYVQVGTGPKIISIKSSPTLQDLYGVLASREFLDLKRALQAFTTHYTSKILEPMPLRGPADYAIQKGVWKFNQYFDIRPGKDQQYRDYLENGYLPTLEGLDYVEVTEAWNVLIGGSSQIVLDLTFEDPVDIGRLLGSPAYREVTYTLCRDHVTNFHSRILRTTERFDEPRWFRL